MEDPATPTVPAKLNGANGSKNNGGSAPKVLKKRGRKPGYKIPRPPGWSPVKYNLHVVLNETEHRIFRALAKDKGASDFVRQLLLGAAISNGLLEAPGPETVAKLPLPCAAGATCTGIVVS